MRDCREFSLAVMCACLYNVYGAASSRTGGELARDKRYLVFPATRGYAVTRMQLILGLGLPMEVDVSMIIGYVIKFNYLLPSNASYFTDPYVRYDRSISRHAEPDGSDASPPAAEAPASRWELYEILESAFESTRSGRACLLKTICEAAAVPFRRSHTLTAQLAHIFLTPSTTSEPFRNAHDQEYRAAEVAGQREPGGCDDLFPECAESLLEYFTEIEYN